MLEKGETRIELNSEDKRRIQEEYYKRVEPQLRKIKEEQLYTLASHFVSD